MSAAAPIRVNTAFEFKSLLFLVFTKCIAFGGRLITIEKELIVTKTLYGTPERCYIKQARDNSAEGRLVSQYEMQREHE